MLNLIQNILFIASFVFSITFLSCWIMSLFFSLMEDEKEEIFLDLAEIFACLTFVFGALLIIVSALGIVFK